MRGRADIATMQIYSHVGQRQGAPEQVAELRK